MENTLHPDQRPPAWWNYRARHAYYQQKFQAMPKKKKTLYGCGSLVAVLALCAICAAVSNASQSAGQPTMAQASPTVAATPTPHPKLWATAVAATETAQARVTPTPKLVPTPTPQPTATTVPIVTPASQPDSTLSVKFTNEDATDHASSSISVQTSPLAALTITVTYCTGKVATSESLRGTVYADSNGAYTWTWVPDTTCYGEAVAKVKASLNGQTATDTVSFGVM